MNHKPWHPFNAQFAPNSMDYTLIMIFVAGTTMRPQLMRYALRHPEITERAYHKQISQDQQTKRINDACYTADMELSLAKINSLAV